MPLSLLELLESSSSKNTTHCPSESGSKSIFPVCVLPLKVSAPLVEGATLWRGSGGSSEQFVHFRSPVCARVLALSHIVLSIPGAFRVVWREHATVLTASSQNTLNIPARFFCPPPPPFSSSTSTVGAKSKGDENAYLAFHIKVTAGEEKQCCKVQ